MKKKIVSVIMGSQSDWNTMKFACDVLKEFNINYEKKIISAHRTPDRLYKYAKNAQKRKIKVIIAGAGGAAHLPGMVASLTILPVIGVPISSTKMDGLDSLYSIVQMPAGIPVATVAIDNAENAAILAVQILLRAHPRFVDNLERFRLDRKNKVLNSSKKRKFIFSP